MALHSAELLRFCGEGFSWHIYWFKVFLCSNLGSVVVRVLRDGRQFFHYFLSVVIVEKGKGGQEKGKKKWY